MKIEYQPSETRTYQTIEIFKVYCEDANVGLLIQGNKVHFIGYSDATLQWDEYGYDKQRLTRDLLLKFVEAYKNRGKDAG